MSDTTTILPPTVTPDTDPTEVKPSWIWMKDSKGYGSVTLTFVTIAFLVTTAAYVLSIIERVGSFTIRPFDVAACAAYMGPIWATYTARKWTEAHYSGKTGTNAS